MINFTELIFVAHIVSALIILLMAMSLGRLMLSYYEDYQPITSLFQAENSSGFNAIYRIIIAPVAIIFISIIFYLLKLDSYVKDIWLVAAYYFVLQLSLIVVLGRWKLANKLKFFTFHIVSIFLSFFLYNAIISKGLTFILPDEANLRTDLWLIVIAFLYGVFRNIPENHQVFKNRKDKYLISKLRYFRQKYRFTLDNYDSKKSEILLAIMIYENFNRPKIIRLIEFMTFSKTRFIMQVEGAKDDKDSIKITEASISHAYDTYINSTGNEWKKQDLLMRVFAIHNPHDSNYPYRVFEIYEKIKDN